MELPSLIFVLYFRRELYELRQLKKNHSEKLFYILGMKLSNRKIKNFQEGTLKSQT